MAAYYNEIDPYAAQWLRNLISAGHIAPGDVDERSIEDVRPDDLRGYDQCHFFAGIGVWSRALRNAGIPDSANIWTGSCPCQPFSAAGKGGGFADERHLWPAFHYLIEECRPAVVFGEQVASAHVNAWLDLVQADLEGLDFAFGACAFPAAGVGAPHIRDRTYWLAYRDGVRWSQLLGEGARRLDQRAHDERTFARLGLGGAIGGLAYADDARSQGRTGMSERADQCAIGPNGLAGGLANSEYGQFQETGWRSVGRVGQPGVVQAPDDTGPTNGYWRNADWLLCRDGKFRPVEPGTFPLVNGASSRVGRLRAYGNAIVLPQATEFVLASIEAIDVTFR